MGLDIESDEDRVNGFAGRLEVIAGPSGRRSWPDSLKAQIVRESLEPGVTVSEVARRHRMSPQHLTLWRRAAREGRLTLSASWNDNGGGGGFVPLAIDAGRSEAAPFVDERISVEVNGVVLKLPAETTAARIAEIVFALEARRRSSRALRRHCAARLWLPGNHSVCYLPHRSRVHLGNVV